MTGWYYQPTLVFPYFPDRPSDIREILLLFSPEGSNILLTCRKIDGGFRFSVQDWGRGIPEEELSKITEPFYMVDKSRARKQNGAGLGLALCQEIAQIHGGSLKIESRLGEGTCVSFVVKEAPVDEN